jgi:hypothetical protein
MSSRVDPVDILDTLEHLEKTTNRHSERVVITHEQNGPRLRTQRLTTPHTTPRPQLDAEVNAFT